MKTLIPIFGFGAQGRYWALSRFVAEWHKQDVEAGVLVLEGRNQPYCGATGTIHAVRLHGTSHTAAQTVALLHRPAA